MFNTECSSCFESLNMFPVKKKEKKPKQNLNSDF